MGIPQTKINGKTQLQIIGYPSWSRICNFKTLERTKRELMDMNSSVVIVGGGGGSGGGRGYRENKW